jgi:hypothetical protein
MLALYLCVLIVFLLHQESLKLILVDEPLPEVVLSQNVRYSSLETPGYLPYPVMRPSAQSRDHLRT